MEEILDNSVDLVIYLEGDIDDPEYLQMENEVNKFAAEILISPSEYTTFIKNSRFYKDDINAFATYLGISPGIVVGRLQKDGLIDTSWHNGLRSRFKWSGLHF